MSGAKAGVWAGARALAPPALGRALLVLGLALLAAQTLDRVLSQVLDPRASSLPLLLALLGGWLLLRDCRVLLPPRVHRALYELSLLDLLAASWARPLCALLGGAAALDLSPQEVRRIGRRLPPAAMFVARPGLLRLLPPSAQRAVEEWTAPAPPPAPPPAAADPAADPAASTGEDVLAAVASAVRARVFALGAEALALAADRARRLLYPSLTPALALGAGGALLAAVSHMRSSLGSRPSPTLSALSVVLASALLLRLTLLARLDASLRARAGALLSALWLALACCLARLDGRGLGWVRGLVLALGRARLLIRGE